ncbi:BTAD domain-containing putative transcriptional regulator [Herbidospora daliensis]|uniref:BTAD domain-containing putative transcriptional regulator n=1 Tax=Herbidospora daliensis TaxID=295585 RepID=UPI000783902D|nr:BTAD domain-containing putative transcriptional regulator [Herbidospora daliensis]
MTPRIRALGPLDVPGAEALTRSGNARRLLAALLVRSPGVVAADTLADVVWQGAPPARADAALQTVVSRLRTQLRAAGLGDVLHTRHPGYALVVDPAWFDVTAFEDLAERGRGLLATRPREALALLDEGLALWRGGAYAEYAHEDFAMAEVARLTELRLSAQEDHAEAALRLNRPEEALATLERVIAESPMRERSRGQLMLALYRLGRQVEALAAYRAYRTMLDEELGLEPQQALRDLETRILRHDPALHPREAAEPASTSLVGRDRLLAELRARLERARVVTLTGPGGVGKTRLAAEVSDDGALVDLSSLPTGAQVAGAMLTALGVHLVDGSPPLDRLVDYLRPRDTLLVLDNCEHVVESAAEAAQAIAAACPAVRILATSRLPLGLPVEQIVPVPPLGAEAVELLRLRAAALAPGVDVAGDAAEELCRRLDGIPLAIELAAGRLRVMSPAGILASGGLLRTSYRQAADRHRTLDAVVDWSYRLLDDADRRLFARLSVFPGVFTAHDAARVCGLDPVAALDRIGDLVDRSMVVAVAGGDVTAYTMLETLRAFARERLAESGEEADLRRAHARDLLELVRRGAERIDGGWAAEVERRFGDIRAAHLWALDHDLTLDLWLIGELADWAELRMPAELEDWAKAAARRWSETGHADDEPLAALALGVAAGCARFRSDYEEARRLAGLSLRLLGPDDPFRRFAVFVQAELALLSGDLDEARRLGLDVLRWSELADDELRAGYVRSSLVLVSAYGGRPEQAVADATAMLDTCRSPVVRGWALYVLGESLLDTDPGRAGELLAQARSQALATGDRYCEGVALTSLASVTARHGDPAAAVDLYVEVITHWERHGNRLQQWATIRGAAFLLAQRGDVASALAVLDAVAAQKGATPLYGADADRLRELRARAAGTPPGEPVGDLHRFTLDRLRRHTRTTTTASPFLAQAVKKSQSPA